MKCVNCGYVSDYALYDPGEKFCCKACRKKYKPKPAKPKQGYKPRTR